MQKKSNDGENLVFQEVFGNAFEDRLQCLQAMENPLAKADFLVEITEGLSDLWHLPISDSEFITAQLAMPEVVDSLFNHYQNILPKFEGAHIAEGDVIWGCGDTYAACLQDAKYWLSNGNACTRPDFEGVKFYQCSDRALAAVKEHGAEAWHKLARVSTEYEEDRYYHRSEVSKDWARRN
jgi:hypothetical protein